MPKVVDAIEQRRAIRQAARRVFARRGVAGTGLARVAAAAGMGRSSLYHYYPDKQTLVRDLLRDLLAEEEALFDAAARGQGSPRERIERLAADLVGTFEAWRLAGGLLLELRSRDARRFRTFFRRIRETLAGLVAEGQRAGEIDRALDPTLVAATVIGAVDGILVQTFVDPPAFPDPEALADGVVGAVRKVLAP